MLAALRNGNVAAAGWEAIIALALRQGVAPVLHRRLQAEGTLAAVPAPLARQLEEERRATGLVNLRNYGAFQRIARTLNKAGIPLIALKGLHLAELVYRDISLRPMSDLDILVPHEHLVRCLNDLRALNYWHNEMLVASTTAMQNLIEILLVHEDSGTLLDVHWGLNESRVAATDLVRELWSRALSARLGEMETLVMPPDFLLLHVCAHFACSDIFSTGVRPLCDIAEIVHAHPGLDWDAVVAHGSRYGWTRGVAAALQLASTHLAVPVPAQALTALGGEGLNATMLGDALAQTFAASALPEGLRTAPNLLALSGAGSFREKARLLWRRVFIPRDELALLYDVPVNSRRLPVYYLMRLQDLSRRYAAATRATIAGDPSLAEAATRHVRLQRWITGE